MFSRNEFSWADSSGRAISGHSDTRNVRSNTAQDTLVVLWLQESFRLADREFNKGRHDFVPPASSLKSESANLKFFFYLASM